MKVPRVFPTIKPCKYKDYTCRRDGNCRQEITKCDGYRDCKDGSDEIGCSGIIGKYGSHAGSIAGDVIGTLIAIVFVVVVVYFVRKQRGNENSLFQVFYSGKKDDQHPEEYVCLIYKLLCVCSKPFP